VAVVVGLAGGVDADHGLELDAVRPHRDHEQARNHYAGSLTLYQQLGSHLGETKIHDSLGFTAERQGRYADALGRAEQALLLFQPSATK
jgi:hypothetical protein